MWQFLASPLAVNLNFWPDGSLEETKANVPWFWVLHFICRFFLWAMHVLNFNPVLCSPLSCMHCIQKTDSFLRKGWKWWNNASALPSVPQVFQFPSNNIETFFSFYCLYWKIQKGILPSSSSTGSWFLVHLGHLGSNPKLNPVLWSQPGSPETWFLLPQTLNKMLWSCCNQDLTHVLTWLKWIHLIIVCANA